MIREARKYDITRLVEMGRRFHEASDFKEWSEYKAFDVAQVIGRMIEHPDSIVFVAEEGGQVIGAAGAMAYGVWFNAKHKTAQELFWYIDPGHRGHSAPRDLLQALERWAAAQGCRTFEMGAIDSLKGEQVGKLYQRRGYRPKERLYIRRM